MQLQYAQKCSAPGATVSLAKVVELIAEADKKFAEAMCKKVTLLQTCVQPGKAIYIPGGWLAVQRPTNRDDARGFRLLLVSDFTSSSFIGLASAMLLGKAVHGNTRLAVLSKVLMGVHQMSLETPLPASAQKPIGELMTVKQEPSSKKARMTSTVA